MLEEIFVSVIIPVYNSEKYIEKCIFSLKNQLFKDTEFIIVNDGSTDDSLNIILKETENDDRFKIINQKNQGVSAARNRGLKEAKGKYIMFVDSDDSLIDVDVIDYLFKKMETTEADVIAFGSKHVFPDGRIINYSFPAEMEVIDLSGDIIETSKKTLSNNDFRYSVWNKIYRADVVKDNNLRFYSYDEVISEDKVFNFNYFVYAKKIVLLGKILYQYSVVENSLSHSKKYNNVIQRVEETINKGSERFFVLQPKGRACLFWILYLDCLSICVELLYSFNKQSWKTVKKGIVSILESTQSLRKEFDDIEINIVSMTNNRYKNLFYKWLCVFIRKQSYKLVADILLSKAKIRMIGKKR